MELDLVLNSNGADFTALVLVLAILFGVVSALRTSIFRRRFGRNPWGIHPTVWLGIGFLLGIIGLCLAFVACATTRAAPVLPGPARAQAENPFERSSAGGGATSEGPPAGWYPDPSGRHEYRFFTGQDWTSDVVDNGVHSTDPLPAPPSSS